jgi:5-methylthioribose kinase
MSSKPVTLTAHNLPLYLKTRGLANSAGEICVQELGGGVSNVVLLAECREPARCRWVVKQSLPKLRVQDDWYSNRERIFREAEAIQLLGNILGSFSLPEVIDVDRNNYAYVMTAAPAGAEPWKTMLLRGEIDAAIARTAGALLAKLISAGRQAPALRDRFEDRTVFDQLRVDPYYRTTAMRHPELRSAYDSLIADSWNVRTSLVHGDYSPKNVLVKGENVCLIDFEVVHWGDPAFDAGFMLNHLFLKACHKPQYRPSYFEAAREFWHSLMEGAGAECGKGFEKMTMRHLGALMLARIDGKSPVEYIRDDSAKQQVRELARRILLEPVNDLEEAIAMAR